MRRRVSLPNHTRKGCYLGLKVRASPMATTIGELWSASPVVQMLVTASGPPPHSLAGMSRTGKRIELQGTTDASSRKRHDAYSLIWSTASKTPILLLEPFGAGCRVPAWPRVRRLRAWGGVLGRRITGLLSPTLAFHDCRFARPLVNLAACLPSAVVCAEIDPRNGVREAHGIRTNNANPRMPDALVLSQHSRQMALILRSLQHRC